MSGGIPAPKVIAHTSYTPAVSENLTILLFGHTGAGKTAQIGELAEFYYKQSGKKTRLYTADRGGWETIKPYVTLGIIEVVPLFDDPWVWLSHAVLGHKWDATKKSWVPGVSPEYALYAYEGMTSVADACMTWMSDAAGKGLNIGGGGSFSFVAGTVEKVKVGSNNQAHYGVAQQRVRDVAQQSQYLPGTVLWTAGDRAGTDDAIGGVVGPQIAGKALTGDAPMWFKYTFRIATDMIPGQPPQHVLYLDSHVELNAKGAKGLSNARTPLAGDMVMPAKIIPASLVKALEMIGDKQENAVDAIAARLGIKR